MEAINVPDVTGLIEECKYISHDGEVQAAASHSFKQINNPRIKIVLCTL